MNKRLTPIQDDDASYDIAKSLTPLRQISVETFSPLTDISSDHLKTHNEPIRASPVYRMTGYSIMKRQTSEHFFAKSQTKGFAPPSSIYRVCYGENVIPSAAEVGPKSTHTTIKPYIPPEYSKYEYKPHHLPTFLKERLYKTVTTKRPVFNTTEDPAPNSGLVDQAGERSILQQLPTEALPSIPRKSRLSKQHSVSVKEFGRISQASIDAGTSKLTDLPDFPYLSPKARQQMNGDSVPLLLTNVLLSGGINPQGLAPNDEAAVEHIINEYHIKSIRQGSVTPIRSKSQPRQKKLSLDKMHNIAVSVSLIQQNKKKKEGIMALQKMNPKYTMDKVGIRLKATVGHMHVEKEETKKRVLDLLKTKNFNLFRPGTINNMHLLKDALSSNEE